MERYEDDISKIREILRDHPKGMSISDIADQAHINRNSVAKYMDILQIQGSVDGYRVGTSKLYILSSRLPAHAIPEVCTRPFLLLDRNAFVTDSNKVMAELLGIPRERIKGMEFTSLPLKIRGTGDDKQVLLGSLAGTSIRVKGMVTPPAGRVREVSLILEPVVFENGKPGTALIVDSPELRVQANEIPGAFSDILALLDDEMEYVVRHMPDGTIRFVNETYSSAAGKAKEDLMNRPFRPLVSPEDAQRIQNHLQALTPENPTGIIEFRAVMAGGEVRWQRWKDRALFNDRGELTGYQSCGLDITELIEIKQDLVLTKDRLNETLLKRTEELRATNRQLYAEISLRDKFEQHLLRTQYVMDHSSDSILLANKNGHIRYTNLRAEKVLGYAADELTDTPLSVIIPAIGIEPFDEFLGQVRKRGEILMESYLVTKAEDKIPVAILMKYLTYHGDDLICCFARDQHVTAGNQDELPSPTAKPVSARRIL